MSVIQKLYNFGLTKPIWAMDVTYKIGKSNILKFRVRTSVLAIFNVTLTQTRIILEEGSSIVLRAGVSIIVKRHQERGNY